MGRLCCCHCSHRRHRFNIRIRLSDSSRKVRLRNDRIHFHAHLAPRNYTSLASGCGLGVVNYVAKTGAAERLGDW